MDRELDRLYAVSEETIVEGQQTTEYWVRPPYRIVHDGEKITVFENGEYRAALACATIVDRYGKDIIADIDNQFVPVNVALDGNPAIASYLYGVHRQSKERVAEVMGVKDRTVTKYLNRFRTRDS